MYTKKLTALLLALLLLASLSLTALADENDAPDSAIPYVAVSAQKLAVYGKDVDVFAAYYIAPTADADGANYFKLRDILQLLKNKADLSYDEETNTILLSLGEWYNPNGTESTEKPAEFDASMWGGESNDAIELTADYYGNGTTLSLTSEYDGLAPMYKIGGSNYIQLKAILSLLWCSADYDESTSTILIDADGQMGDPDAPPEYFGAGDTYLPDGGVRPSNDPEPDDSAGEDATPTDPPAGLTVV
ncbi:MAG: hypothetical protein LBC65_05105 [Oscillospiraceae bacterium]|jgi:hypothetical protein|nr:hypothetical protein [Oscillospiraceae bacterium]